MQEPLLGAPSTARTKRADVLAPTVYLALALASFGRPWTHANLQFLMLETPEASNVPSFTHEVLEQIGLIVTLQRGDRVVQLGANMGTSCILASRLLGNKDPSDVVCVEPTPTFWVDLKRNRAYANAQFDIIKGYLSPRGRPCPTRKQYVGGCTRYGHCHSVPEHQRSDPVLMAIHGTVHEIACHEWDRALGHRPPTVLFADCEGCMAEPDLLFVSANNTRGVRALVYEDDMHTRPKRSGIHHLLDGNGFASITTSYLHTNRFDPDPHAKPTDGAYAGAVRVWLRAAGWRVHLTTLHFALELATLAVGGSLWLVACCLLWRACVGFARAGLPERAPLAQWAVACVGSSLVVCSFLYGVPAAAHFWSAPLLLSLSSLASLTLSGARWLRARACAAVLTCWLACRVLVLLYASRSGACTRRCWQHLAIPWLFVDQTVNGVFGLFLFGGMLRALQRSQARELGT